MKNPTNAEVLDVAIKEIKEYKDEAFEFKQFATFDSPNYHIFSGYHKAYIKTIEILEEMKKNLK